MKLLSYGKAVMGKAWDNSGRFVVGQSREHRRADYYNYNIGFRVICHAEKRND